MAGSDHDATHATPPSPGAAGPPPDDGVTAAEREALEQAVEAARGASEEGVGHPYGAALVVAGRVVAVEANRVRATCDPTAHAEVQVIRTLTARRGSRDLSDCTLVTTAEPCHMCAGAVEWAGILRVVVGTRDPVNGGMAGLLARRPEIASVVVDSPACRVLLSDAHRY
jgi:tRNA(Arg) A34 adenosine deaminase TadA